MARAFTRASSHTISLPSVADLTTAMTFGCWLQTASASAVAEYRTLCGKGRSGDATDRNFGFDFRRVASGNEGLEMYWTQPVNNYSEYYFDVTLSLNTWYHLVWTADWSTNPDTVACYLNGAAQSLSVGGSTDATPTTGATPVPNMGAFHGGGSDYWDGRLAEGVIMPVAITEA